MNKRMQSLVERDSDGSWLPAGFEPYTLALQEACLDLFDANCPASFAPNERSDYAAFLDQAGGSYFVKPQSGRAAAAFGLKRGAGADSLRLNWIMVHPAVHSGGVGRTIMEAVIAFGRLAGATRIEIAASHLSEPFFARFSAITVGGTRNGWGPDMHRVDMEISL